MTAPREREEEDRKLPPKLCYHVDLTEEFGRSEPFLDPYSLRINCNNCKKVGTWLSEAYARAHNKGKPNERQAN